ncbi:hypothetical protein D3C81_544940 [compost metagenome]
MNRNSERNRPTPLAPDSRANGQSSGNSIFASRVMGVPHLVTAGVFFSLPSFLRARCMAVWRSRYCSSTRALGLAMTTPASPSMISQSSWSISIEACDMPTAAGISRLRATMAVCEFCPPTSVMKPMKERSRNCSMSAGEMSCATTIICAINSSSAAALGSSCSVPSKTFNTRSATCWMSALRSRRYGSSISSNCADNSSICVSSAHSAL